MHVDLNLIRPLCVLLEERHVSRAAERCAISQPAMSRIFERLRVAFDDELLVRCGRAYERTPRAEALLAEFRDILNRMDATLSGGRFAPERCDATIKLATTDYASVVFLPHLFHDLQRLAPHVSVISTAWNDHGYDDLAAGRIDVAIMSADDPPPTLSAEPLFREDYLCVVAAGHPARGRRMTLATYLRYGHAVIDIVQGGQPGIDQHLRARNGRRRVAYRTPFLGSAVFAIAHTEMILTAPRRLAELYRSFAAVRTLEAPEEIAGFTYSLLWHKRFESSPAHAWFRERVRAVANARFGGRGERRAYRPPSGSCKARSVRS